jgi:hypothetical protein
MTGTTVGGGIASSVLDIVAGLVTDIEAVYGPVALELIEHPVGVNWRQRYNSVNLQVSHVESSLIQIGPFRGTRVAFSEFHRHALQAIDRSGHAVSLTSRVWGPDGLLLGHLPIMNLHPVGYSSIAQLQHAIAAVVDGRAGYLADSGRFFHYYGSGLLSTSDWLRFLACFLMPCTLVSPRYIGHSLYRDFTSLRLNAAPPFKPAAPFVISKI